MRASARRLLISDLRWIGTVGVSGRGDGLLQQEDISQVAGLCTAAGVPKPVVTQLVEAGRKDVLKKAPNELVACDRFLAMAVGRAILVAVGNGVVVDGQDAAVGNGDAEGVARKIVEGRLLAATPGGDVDDPGDLPDLVWQIGPRAELEEGVAEPGAGQGGQGRFGEQEGLAGGMPGGAVVGQSAAGNQAVSMRVENESLGPAMQHGQYADGATDPARIAREIDDRGGGGLDQPAIAVDLMAV